MYIIWTDVTFCQFSLSANAFIEIIVGIRCNFTWLGNCPILAIIFLEWSYINIMKTEWETIRKAFLFIYLFIYLFIW